MVVKGIAKDKKTVKVGNKFSTTYNITTSDGEVLEVKPSESYCLVENGDKVVFSSKSLKGKPVIIVNNSEFSVMSMIDNVTKKMCSELINTGAKKTSSQMRDIFLKHKLEGFALDTFYKYLKQQYEDVGAYLDRVCTSPDQIDGYNGDVAMFKSHWKKHRIDRRFSILGIRNNTIEFTIENYNKICDYPYAITSMTIEQCKDMLSGSTKKVEKIGVIARKIYDIIIKQLERHCDNFIYLSSAIEDANYDEQTVKECLKYFHYFPITIVRDTLDLKELRNAHDNTQRYYKKVITPCDINDCLVYSKECLSAELVIAEMIIGLSEAGKQHINIVRIVGDTCDSSQLKAIEEAVNNNVSVITGCGGTGKTTIIDRIVKINESKLLNTLLLAPTGAAASHLRKVTRFNSSTLHFFIMSRKLREKDYDHLIIDESSMVTGQLLAQVLQFLPKIKKITFIGDDAQLPPIDGFHFFRKIINSNRIVVSKLTVNHRFGSDSRLAKFAGAIRDGEEFDFESGGNLKFLPDSEESVKKCIRFLRGKELNGKPITTSDFVVICPYLKYTYDYNEYVQKVYRKDYLNRTCIELSGYKYYAGDKIMVVKNNYAIDIFNGEEGKVVTVRNRSFTAEFMTRDGPRLIEVYELFSYTEAEVIELIKKIIDVDELINVLRSVKDVNPERIREILDEASDSFLERTLTGENMFTKEQIAYLVKVITANESGHTGLVKILANFRYGRGLILTEIQISTLEKYHFNSKYAAKRYMELLQDIPVVSSEIIALSYSCSVDKFQGRGCPIVIAHIPSSWSSSAGSFLIRERFYTLASRAYSRMYIACDKELMRNMIKKKARISQDRLKQLLIGKLPNVTGESDYDTSESESEEADIWGNDEFA